LGVGRSSGACRPARTLLAVMAAPMAVRLGTEIRHTFALLASELLVPIWEAICWVWAYAARSAGTEVGAARFTRFTGGDRTWELGITFFDTVDAYRRGYSEELLGRSLKTVPRDKVYVATKVGPWRGRQPNQGSQNLLRDSHRNKFRITLTYCVVVGARRSMVCGRM
jgi:hypothetical protein